MKKGLVSILAFFVLFGFGIYLTSMSIPKDDASLTKSYVQKVQVYLPPLAIIQKEFNGNGIVSSEVRLGEYKKIATENSRNVVTHDLVRD